MVISLCGYLEIMYYRTYGEEYNTDKNTCCKQFYIESVREIPSTSISWKTGFMYSALHFGQFFRGLP